MKYAKKLNLRIPSPPALRKDVTLGEHGRLADEPNASVTRKYIPKKYVDAVLSVLPEVLRDRVIYVNYAEIRVSGPHTHATEQCVINYYLQANGECTAFYEGEARIDPSVVVDSGNDYFPIAEDSVEEVENFVAESDDVWLLCTRQPHSIYFPETKHLRGKEKYRHRAGVFRKAIQVYMDVPYEEAAGFLS
jgi:hypothetical protein